MSKPNWNEIRQEWETTKITFKDLAEKHNVKLGTLKSRRSREKWSRDPAKIDATLKIDASKVATPKNKPRYKEGSRKGAGNPNPVKQFTKRNSAAVTHGFFAKYLPDETKDIIEDMQGHSPADLIYSQIEIQFAAIIRAQQIMFIENKDEMIKELKKEKQSMDSEEIEYEFQFAWDRHATFMNAQSRAMSELRSLIKQFNEMAHEDDERRLRLEQMQIGIDKTKAEIDNLSNGSRNESAEDWVTALKEVADKRRVKQDEQ